MLLLCTCCCIFYQLDNWLLLSLPIFGRKQESGGFLGLEASKALKAQNIIDFWSVLFEWEKVEGVMLHSLFRLLAQGESIITSHYILGRCDFVGGKRARVVGLVSLQYTHSFHRFDIRKSFKISGTNIPFIIVKVGSSAGLSRWKSSFFE